jgi:hypothetical protein
LALWLLALGEVVLDIPTTATARVRELSRGGRRKNDRIDAAAAASVAALQGDARQVYPETTTDFWRSSMSVESTCHTAELELSTSCTPCYVS